VYEKEGKVEQGAQPRLSFASPEALKDCYARGSYGGSRDVSSFVWGLIKGGA
jgi:hypothetical protein